TLLMAAGLARMALAPLFSQDDEPKSRSEIAGWTAISMGVLVAMATWITRQSLVEAMAPPPAPAEHAHSIYHGGQMVMWGDYHAEVARAVSGEYRVWLTDVYRRSISAEYFSGTIYPREPKSGKLGPGIELEKSLDNDYLMAVMDRDIKSVEVFLKYPGNTIRLDFEFDSAQGRKSVKEWCGR
ncbi:MAG: hypothetical protein KIS61_10435, partial [Candidatus Eremiobacteraeota bacterium]|nr:hypothetical protein [Candidatus Eremiobacteraeota bacterium]